MREILFRGKDVYGNWLYGDLINLTDEIKQICNFSQLEHAHGVNPETVGQYTGLTDKNGTKIFEGDIVKAQDEIFGSPFCDGITGKIVYAESAYFIEPRNPIESQWLFNECAVYEILGNIHDNPELLEVEQ